MEGRTALMVEHRLKNGLRVVGEYMPGFSSVSMGVWIGAGSVYEQGAGSGSAHFIEHMLFKGTGRRTASDIAEQMDAVGGNLNAFTGKECTCFYGRVLDRDIEVLTDVLADMIADPKLDRDDLEREKGVVLEEISMTEDTPEDLVTETANSLFYEGDPLERPILGTAGTVRGFDRGMLLGYMQSRYCAQNAVVSVAGAFEEDKLIALLEKCFEGMPGGKAAPVEFSNHTPARRLRLINKDIEQVHICMCLPGFRKDTPESYAQLVFSNAFGGSMSSRLFQRIREQMGLAYSVYAYPTAYPLSGCLTLYAGAGRENALDVARLMLEEADTALKEGLSIEELSRAKQQLISSYLMSRESTAARASALGRAELVSSRLLTEAEVIERIESVSADDIAAILPRVFGGDDISVAAVGRLDGAEKGFERLILKK